MTEQTGVIQAINTKPVAGGKLAYDIIVAGTAFGVGLYAPKASVGDYVKFEIDDSRGYKNVARGTLKVSRNKPPAEAVAQAEATKPAVSSTGVSFDARQDIISRQAAMNTAIEFMKVAQSTEALGLPADAKGKGQKLAALEDMLFKYTQEFYERNTGTSFKDISPVKSGSSTAEAVHSPAPAVAEVKAEDDSWE